MEQVITTEIEMTEKQEKAIQFVTFQAIKQFRMDTTYREMHESPYHCSEFGVYALCDGSIMVSVTCDNVDWYDYASYLFKVGKQGGIKYLSKNGTWRRSNEKGFFWIAPNRKR